MLNIHGSAQPDRAGLIRCRPLVWGLVAVTLGLGRPAAVLALLVVLGVSLIILSPNPPKEGV